MTIRIRRLKVLYNLNLIKLGLTEQRNIEVADKDRRIDEINSEIARMSHFYDREEGYKQKILELEQTIKEKEYGHHDEMRKMEKNFFKQN